MVEVDAVHVGFDHVVANGLAKTEQAIFLAQGEKMLEQARAVMRGQLPHQDGGALSGPAGGTGLGGTAKIFIGYGTDGLAQFERVHFGFLLRQSV
ncbi:hypothetical protein D3C81_1199060 [compost metagenome]